jgi:hypothetical protein
VGNVVVVGALRTQEGSLAATWRGPGEEAFGPARVFAADTSRTANASVDFAGSETVVMWTGQASGDRAQGLRHVYAGVGTREFGFGAAQMVSDPAADANGLDMPNVAGGPRGDVAAAWTANFERPPPRVDATLRRPGTGFVRTPSALPGSFRSISVDVDRKGQIALVGAAFPDFDHSPRSTPIVAGFGSASGYHLDRVSVPQPLFEPAPVVAIDGFGTAAVVTWHPNAPKDGLTSWTRLADGTIGGYDWLSLPGRYVMEPELEFDAVGRGIAVWDDYGTTGRIDQPYTLMVSEWDGRFAAARKPPVIRRTTLVGRQSRASAKAKRWSRPPSGASFDLSKDARVRLVLTRRGRRGLYRTIARMTRRARFGHTTIAFSKRTRRRARRRGHYRLVVKARDRRGQVGRQRTVRFRIARR